MKEKIIKYLSCPNCSSDLKLDKGVIDKGSNGDEIKEGYLNCINCGEKYYIKNFIPRFVPEENYAESFGLQWNIHAKTQIDKFSGTNITSDRFYDSTKWGDNLKNQKILEVGCGAGRFTQIAIETGAEVFSFDYSNAVDANLTNNRDKENINFFQADIYKIPFKKGMFDKIFCLGVLQHCPDVKGAFISLIPYLKNGGEVVIDVYLRTWKKPFVPYYYYRSITKRMNPKNLYAVVKKAVPFLLPIKRKIKKIPIFGKFIHFLIPIADYSGQLPLNEKQLTEWAILDTFDMLSPRYDTPQSIDNVKKWFSEAGLKNVEVRYGSNGIVGKGTKL